MKLITFEMRELKADENMVLTNGETFSSIGGSVYLGVNDSTENWYEITAEQAEQLQTENIEITEEDLA